MGVRFPPSLIAVQRHQPENVTVIMGLGDEEIAPRVIGNATPVAAATRGRQYQGALQTGWRVGPLVAQASKTLQALAPVPKRKAPNVFLRDAL